MFARRRVRSPRGSWRGDEDRTPTQERRGLVRSRRLLLSALVTELIGIHAMFGAFLFGAIIPHDSRAGARS